MLWIDVTPAEPPGFDASRVELISHRQLEGGIREIDLGDSGIAVLGGPGLKARAVARRVATSIDPYL